MFKKNNPGCPCCDCNRTLVVHGCNNTAIGGKVVTLSQGGVTKASCTTGDGTGGTTLGQCIVSIPAGTYDVSIPAGDNYAAFSGTLTHTCPGGGSSTFNLVPATGYVCACSCSVPVPDTLFVSDGEGTHTLAYEGASSNAWSCIYASSITGKTSLCEAGTTLYVLVRFTCAPWTLTIRWSARECAPGGGLFCTPGDTFFPCVVEYLSNSPGPPSPSIEVSAADTSHACSPFSATFNVPTSNTTFFPLSTGPGEATPGGGGAMTVTP